MPRNLFKLLGRAGVYLEENKDDGSDLPGGGDDTKTPEQIAADVEAAAAAETKRLADLAATEADGKPNGEGKPSDAEAKLLKELMGYKAKATAAADELKAYKDAAGESKPEELKALIEAKKNADREALEKRGEYDRILEQVKTEHQTALTTLQAKVDELTLQMNGKDEALVDLTVGRSFSDSAFIREKSLLPVSIARKEFGAHVDIVDGQAVVYDKPRGAAERTPLVDGNGKPKSFEQGIEALYAAHPEAKSMIRAAGKPGAGSKSDETKKPDNDGNKQVAPGTSRIAAALEAQSKKQ